MPVGLPASETGVLKLLGEHFSYVIPPNNSQPPSLILGRKLTTSVPTDVFPVAADRNISRQHARLYWEPTVGHWMVECLGKNGMHVDDRFVDGNARVILDWADGLFVKMQIGDVVFFVMQPEVLPQNGQGQQSDAEQQRGAR